jgi:hypothetical protein
MLVDVFRADFYHYLLVVYAGWRLGVASARRACFCVSSRHTG